MEKKNCETHTKNAKKTHTNYLKKACETHTKTHKNVKKYVQRTQKTQKTTHKT